MAYKPVSQNVTDNKNAEIPSSDAVFDKIVQEINNVLPEQSGNSGKFLQTDGLDLNWVSVYPSQSTNAGKFLTTDGNEPSWSTIPESANLTLSNLTAPTAVNAPLLLQNGDTNAPVIGFSAATQLLGIYRNPGYQTGGGNPSDGIILQGLGSGVHKFSFVNNITGGLGFECDAWEFRGGRIGVYGGIYSLNTGGSFNGPAFFNLGSLGAQDAVDYGNEGWTIKKFSRLFLASKLNISSTPPAENCGVYPGVLSFKNPSWGVFYGTGTVQNDLTTVNIVRNDRNATIFWGNISVGDWVKITPPGLPSVIRRISSKTGDSLTVDQPFPIGYAGALPINSIYCAFSTLIIGDTENNTIVEIDYKSDIFVKNYRIDPHVEIASTSIDWKTATTYELTLSSSVVLTFSNPVNGGSYILKINQNNIGGHTITWPANIKWAGGPPSLTGTANSIDVATMVYINGTYYASFAADFV